MLELISRFRAKPIKEHIHYFLPFLYTILNTKNRFHIFRNTSSTLDYKNWALWILLGVHSTNNGFSLSNYDVWIAKRPNDATFNFCLNSSYMNNLESILQSIDRETNFVDIGANLGIFSLIAAKNPMIKTIHAFEPDKVSFEFLLRNIEKNRAQIIEPYNVAIGESSGTVLLSKVEGHSGLSKIVAYSESNAKTSFKIQMIDHSHLNTFLNINEYEYFIKIDVEGYEFQVLKTLLACRIFPKVKSFYLEFDKNMGKVGQVEEFLTENGFTECGRWGTNSHWDALWQKV
jgi:FkbM family methyltransferase